MSGDNLANITHAMAAEYCKLQATLAASITHSHAEG